MSRARVERLSQLPCDEIQEVDEMLRHRGQYGPKIEVGADAELQTRLIAFRGRRS